LNFEINNNFAGIMIPNSISQFKAVDIAYFKVKPNTSIIRKELGQMVYKLYGLTDEEIRIVEKS